MTTSIHNKSLLVRSSLLALVLALGAPATALAQAADDGTGQVEDIVVTAQKREERSLTVPIAISTISARALEAQGVTSTSNLAMSVPGLQINRSLNSATPFIRGVGNPSGAAGEEGATAIYIDGVYNSNQYANLFELNSIERIEVLKGPQGTLFGRNSAGGAILVTTKTPSHDFGLNAFVGYANYDTISGGAYVTGGLTETIAANLAVQASDQNDPWGRNLTTGSGNGISKYFSIRSKLLWEIGDRTRVTLAGDYYRQKESLRSHVFTQTPFATPGFYDTLGNVDSSTDMKNYGGSLRIEHDADPFQIVSITAHRKTRSYGIFDFDSLPLQVVSFEPLTPRDMSWLQEVQVLSNPGSDIKWVAGVFLFHNTAGYYPFIQRGLGTLATAGGFIDRRDVQTTNSFAGFAQATFPILENTHLTLGGRYSIDDRKLDYVQVSYNPVTNATVTLAPAPVKVSYPKATWRIALDHQFTPDVMIYASYNTGFKSGLFNLNTPTDPAVRPETIDALEAGLKARLLDGRLQVEASGFHYKFKDIQLRKVLTTGGTQLLNAAAGRIYGFDLSVQAVPVDNLSLNGSLEVLNTRFTRFPNAPGSVPLPATATAGVCPAASSGPATGGNLTCTLDATGNDMLQAPPFTANIGATYTIPVGESSIVLNGAYSYNSGFFWEPDNRLKEKAYENVNASIAWKAPEDRWQVRVWGQNLTNTKRSSLTVSSGTGDSIQPSSPRTYGVTLSAKFGS